MGWVQANLLNIGYVVILAVVAILGAVGLAVGLALQCTLASLAAGVMLILFRPYKVGDFVEAGGTFGKVAAITLFTTDMITFANQHIIIPKSEIWGAKIINHSHHSVRGVDMIVSVAYGSDIKKPTDLFSNERKL